MIDNETYEIADNEPLLSMDCNGGDCKIQIHAKPVDAVALVGAAIPSMIQTFFKVAKKADVPKDVAVEPLKDAIIEAFEDAGFEVTFDLCLKDED